MGLMGVWGRVPSTRASCTGEDKAGPHLLSSVDFTFLHSGARQPPRKGGYLGQMKIPKANLLPTCPLLSLAGSTARCTLSRGTQEAGAGREVVRGAGTCWVCISGW